MKITVLFLYVLSLLSIASGNNNDDGDSGNPIDQLPPAIQTGENTFGTQLDGELFIPSRDTNPLDCVYQLINGERFFTLQASSRDENFNLLGLSLSTNARVLDQREVYTLVSEFVIGGVFSKYLFNGYIFDTDEQNSGQLIITHLYLEEQIISGTFWYDVIDQNGDLKEIQDSRFDMQFM